jgi:hypothetical protein
MDEDFAFWIGIILVGSILGIILGLIARSKSRDFFAWWIYGAALFLTALVHSPVIRPNHGGSQQAEAEQLASQLYRKCPSCAELVKTEATICRYCRHCPA